jgi:hypothetical protein
MQLVHDMWCHPGNDKMEQICKARRGRGFPRGFISQLRQFHCATCAVSKRTRRYRRSKRVKVAAAKRATQARTLRTRKPSSDEDLNDSKNAEHAGEQEAKKQGSGTDIKQLTCHGCQRIFGSAQGLASHLKDTYRCPSSSNYQQPTAEPARRVRQRAEASNEAAGVEGHWLLVTRELLVCAWRAETSLPEPVLDGSAAVGVAVQGHDWVNHFLLCYWAQKGLWHGVVLHPLRAAEVFRAPPQGARPPATGRRQRAKRQPLHAPAGTPPEPRSVPMVRWSSSAGPAGNNSEKFKVLSCPPRNSVEGGLQTCTGRRSETEGGSKRGPRSGEGGARDA